MPPVSILLATYNSERYVGELIQSILDQSYRDFRLFIRDDCSLDYTRRVVARYAGLDDRIEILENNRPSGSAGANFFSLLALAELGDSILFADSDDVWLPNKLERSLESLRSLESRYGRETPLLCHCDLRVVDAALREIAPSLWRYEKLSVERTALRQLLCQNNITGCATIINRAAADLVKTPPQHAVMHDWWLGLICAAFGHIEPIDEALILYRQHGQNEVGAYNARDPAAALRKLGRRAHIREVYAAMYAQAGEFAETFKDRLSAEQYALCKSYAEMPRRNKLGRLACVVKNGFYKNTLVRNIGQFLMI